MGYSRRKNGIVVHPSLISVCVYLCLLSVAFAGVQINTDVDICVIGAGPAGIQATYSAEAKGYSVAVLEQNAYVGGKTKAIKIGLNNNGGRANPYFLGAIIHAGSKHSNLNRLAEKFDVKGLDVTLPEFKVEWIKDGTIDDTFQLNYFRIIPEGLKYVIKRCSLSKYLDGPEGYLSDYPEELQRLSLQDWLVDNGMPTLNDLFWQYMTTYGYDHPKNFPALFGLKLVTAAMLINVLVPFGLSTNRAFPFQELIQRMTDTLKGTVYLEANISSVTYEERRTLLHFSLMNVAPPEEYTISCGSTIIAFAPTADAMSLFTPPDSGELTSLFEQVQTTNYFTLLIDDSDSIFDNEQLLKYHVPEPFVPDNPARNLLYWKQQDFPDSSVSTYYLTPTKKSEEQALQESLADYSKLVGRTVTEAQVQDFNSWADYFPHPSSKSLQSGFFQKFASFQGHYGQYYTGGLFNFDMVQDSMEHAEYIIETEF